MSDPENIQGVLNAKPDYLGYIFYPKSKRYVGDKPNRTIFEMVPISTQKVAVFVNEEAETVGNICQKFHMDIAQLHGNESPKYCQEVRDFGLTIFKAFSVNEQFDFSILTSYQDVVDFFLFDTKGELPGGTGLKFNWEILKDYHLPVPFLLSGGIKPNDIEELASFNHEQLYALDINSGFEISPAVKDTKKVNEFISQIRKTYDQ